MYGFGSSFHGKRALMPRLVAVVAFGLVFDFAVVVAFVFDLDLRGADFFLVVGIR